MRFVLYGASTLHASELLESARRLGWELATAVVNVDEGTVPAEIEDVVGVDALAAELLALPFAVPQTTPGARRATVADARARGFGAPLTLVDPTAVVASSARLGAGVYVGAGAVIGTGTTIGEGGLINRSCSVAHHVVLGEYATTGPAAVLAGASRVEDGAFIGAGAVLAPEVHVGAGAVIGAGAVVIRDVEAGTTVVGNPARPV